MSAKTSEHHLVVADRGHLRIYRIEREPGQATPALRAALRVDFVPGREGYVEREADQAGRFPGGTGGAGGGGMSIDERLPLQREHERRLVGEAAARINGFFQEHRGSTWDFSAAPDFGWPVLDRLDPSVRDRLGVSMMKNLAGEPEESLLAHFSD